MPVEYSSIRDYARKLGKVPIELRRELRPALRHVGEILRTDMRRRASYSSRIPGAIKMTTSFSSRSGGIKFKVDAKQAPHARVLELGNHGGRASTFRHPVFGNTNNWVTQPTRPFFFPALKAGGAPLRRGISQAVSAAQRKALS